MDEKAVEKIIDFIKGILPPWATTALIWIVVVGAAGFVLSVIYRVIKGEELKIWKLELKPNKMLVEQKKLFDQLNEDSLQKKQILQIIDKINLEASRAFASSTMNDFHRRKAAIYQMVLHAIGTILTKSRSNSHRVAIFVEESGTGMLKVRESSGLSPDGKEKLRLPILNSAAGHAFRNGNAYRNGNIHGNGTHFTPHPEAKKVYNSLMCVPIKCGDHIIGVLSVDGEEENSFDNDDEDYLNFFANALSILMYFDNVVVTQRGDGDSIA